MSLIWLLFEHGTWAKKSGWLDDFIGSDLVEFSFVFVLIIFRSFGNPEFYTLPFGFLIAKAINEIEDP